MEFNLNVNMTPHTLPAVGANLRRRYCSPVGLATQVETVSVGAGNLDMAFRANETGGVLSEVVAGNTLREIASGGYRPAATWTPQRASYKQIAVETWTNAIQSVKHQWSAARTGTGGNTSNVVQMELLDGVLDVTDGFSVGGVAGIDATIVVGAQTLTFTKGILTSVV